MHRERGSHICHCVQLLDLEFHQRCGDNAKQPLGPILDLECPKAGMEMF